MLTKLITAPDENGGFFLLPVQFDEKLGKRGPSADVNLYRFILTSREEGWDLEFILSWTPVGPSYDKARFLEVIRESLRREGVPPASIDSIVDGYVAALHEFKRSLQTQPAT